MLLAMTIRKSLVRFDPSIVRVKQSCCFSISIILVLVLVLVLILVLVLLLVQVIT